MSWRATTGHVQGALTSGCHAAASNRRDMFEAAVRAGTEPVTVSSSVRSQKGQSSRSAVSKTMVSRASPDSSPVSYSTPTVLSSNIVISE